MVVKEYLTSESVSMGHPDKLADQISDAVLDECLKDDPHSRVACETLVTTGLCIMAGEISTKAWVDFNAVARQVMLDVGYDNPDYGIDGNTCAVLASVGAQSPDISRGVDGVAKKKGKSVGAGDQGMMFGIAIRETPELMPMPIMLAHKIMQKLTQLRKQKKIAWLRPDSKCQVTVEYHDGKPARVNAVVLSTQHEPDVKQSEICKTMIEQVIKKVIPNRFLDSWAKYYINPTGRFVIGGPHGDCGLTGRKIIVDTYGGLGRHGGGAFSGKDPSKVDRSGAYAARHVAKNIVAAGLAERVEVQIAYSIGIAEPLAVHVETFGSGKIAGDKIARIVLDNVDLTPTGIIGRLNLNRPIYRQTAYHGHFGRKGADFTWEKTDLVDVLRKAARL
jgi:S-adenosylmethionine synthetase